MIFLKNAFFWIAAMLFALGFLVLDSALTPAHADDIEGMWLTTGEWSRHTDEGVHKYRQNNTGIGVQFDMSPDNSIVAGYYNNSIHRETVYAGMTYTPLHAGDAKFGLVGVMATGYTELLPAVPIGGLYASYEVGRAGINFMWLPQVVAAVQLKIKLF